MNGKLSTAAVIIISVFAAAADIVISGGRHYKMICGILSALAILPYITVHGNRKAVSYELRTIILTTLMSAAMLALFSDAAYFRPVTAVVIITGMLFGSPAGFTCGFFSVMLVSGFSGIGEWTVIQLLVISVAGFLSGVFSKKMVESNIFLTIFSLFCSFAFSCADIISAVDKAQSESFFSAYRPVFAVSVKWFAFYAVSDIILILLTKRLFAFKALRMKKRFKIFA